MGLLDDIQTAVKPDLAKTQVFCEKKNRPSGFKKKTGFIGFLRK